MIFPAAPDNSVTSPAAAAAMRFARRIALVQWGMLAILFAIMGVVNYEQSAWRAAANAVFGVTPALLASLAMAAWSLRTTSRRADSKPVWVLVGGHVCVAYLVSAIWMGWLWLRVASTTTPQIANAFYDRWWLWQLHTAVWPLLVPAAVAHATRLSLISAERRTLLARAQRARVEAELALLRAHLGPHFLFNTLHALGGLVHIAPEVADRRLERLQSMLSYLFEREAEDPDGCVPFDREWQFVEQYLAFESDRLGNRLRIAVAIDDGAREVRVPPLLVQPLVENAIRHGVARRMRGGTVRISARLIADAQLEFRIADDGPGAEPEALQKARGLGLRAVRQRVAYMGADASMSVDTAPDAGFSVCIRIPAVMRRGEHVTVSPLEREAVRRTLTGVA